MVLETTWGTPTGWAVVRDVLLVGPWRHGSARSAAHRRVPVDQAAEHVLLRTARCLTGSLDFVLQCEPAFDYGRRRGVWQHTGAGYGQAEVQLDGEAQVRLTTDLNLGFEGPRAIARRRLRAGDQVFCALSRADATAPETFAEAHEWLAGTAELWHEWLSRGDFPDHPWRKHLQIMYGIGGERELTEQVLDHLSGYDGARPVRIGNGAWDQRQHDVWGVLLDSAYLHTRSRDRLDERRWPMLKRQAEAAIMHRPEPDQGLWEVRGPARHFTSSKIMCWVADEIHADVCANGTDDRGVFCQHYETTALDASLLLIPLVGFLPPDDDRVRATVLAIADELTEDELVLRYRVEATDDGFSGEEGTFTICSFWLVSALTEVGGVERARALCEKLLCYASPLFPYAEEIDPHTGRHLGNFPQAFSRLSLINAVMHLIRDDERRSAGSLG
jgi:GH15 family glucan-1,4-alpha-glucosidase